MRLERDDYVIQGIPWCVTFDHCNSELSLEDAYGRTNFDTRTITLASDMCFEETIETLIHETSHVIVHGREGCDLTKEDDLRWYSIALVDTIIRNGLTFDLEDTSGW